MPGQSHQKQEIDLSWEGTTRTRLDENLDEVILHTNRGDITARFHDVPLPETEQIQGGVVWVGGAGGGLEGPACGLYPACCQALQNRGMAGLRLHYRFPNDIEECVMDTLLGVEFMSAHARVANIGLVGHSFGGAVVITAGALSDKVTAVVPMSTQTYGTELVPRIAPRPLLLIHGTSDNILPPQCSEYVYKRAGEPKELRLFQRAGHGLDEVREEVLQLVVTWLEEKLRG